MSSEYLLKAETRSDLGKGASRRLRRLENKVLGIVFGGDKEPVPLMFAMNEIVKLTEKEAFFTSLVDLRIDGKSEQVVVKDMQRHPAKETVMHIDLMRIDVKSKFTMHIPLHFINEDICLGVKESGGTISHALNDIEVTCLPKDLPEYIEVDMALVDVGENVHISDLILPEGVDSIALTHGEDYDLLVSAVNAPRGGGSDEDEEEDNNDAGEDSTEAAAE